MAGKEMYEIVKQLFPICRSITGDGVRETLSVLKNCCNEIKVCEVPSGTKVFDWTVPKEWNIRDAYIEDEEGKRILDFKRNNLHVMGYSLPMDCVMSLEELKPFIYTEEGQPDVIPYVTSYYKERVGFCMSENQKQGLKEGNYHVVMDTSLKDGYLTYGELLVPSTEKTEKEILFSAYICHPSMANNELSGPAVSIYLAKWLFEQKNRNYNYRFLFIPETIGSITYISQHIDTMKKNIIAGFSLSCVGDNRTFSYIESRYGDTLADRVLKNVLHFYYPNFKEYSFLERGSDERQYCAPGVDLPVVAFCRSKYGEYPEYHTSADDLNLISPEGLQGSFEVLKQCIMALEYNRYYKINCLCEPQLGKRGLYPTISKKGKYDEVYKLTNIIAYADGKNDLIDISNRIEIPICEMIENLNKLLDAQLFSFEK
ncbi:MAG: DUF4910 domain-containing protein [Acetivibrio sp.]